MTRPIRRAAAASLATLAGAALLAVWAAPVAGAHVEPAPAEVTAGEATTVEFTAEHGCDESPTTGMDLQVPDGVTDVAPVDLAGWDATVADDVVTFAVATGTEPAEGVTVGITFTPTNPGRLQWKVVQSCAAGEIAWIEEWDGVGAEPELPAPAVQVVEWTTPTTAVPSTTAADDATTTTAAPTTTVAESTTSVDEGSTSLDATTTGGTEAAAADDGDDGGNEALIAGLLVAAVAAVAGAWFWWRRRTATG